MYNYCFCPRLVIQCFLVQPMLNVGTVCRPLYCVHTVKDLLDFKCYFLALCFKFQPISYVHCHILLSCAKFFECFQLWQQKMWGGGLRLEYQLVWGGMEWKWSKYCRKWLIVAIFCWRGRGQVGQRILRAFALVGRSCPYSLLRFWARYNSNFLYWYFSLGIPTWLS